MRYLIETYGCQMNVAESNAIEALLQGRGLERTDSPELADCVILNTCSVRKTAENRIWGRLGFYSAVKRQHHIMLIVTGCMAERMKDELKREAPYVDYVIGNNQKAELPGLILGEDILDRESYSFFETSYKEGEFSCYVPIMNGCNNFCTYCIVPYVRGREVSRPPEEIVKEICFLDSKGVREITLLGQNVNSYKAELGGKKVDFPGLLELIIPCLDNIRFVRFESPHPKDFDDHLIKVIAESARVCSHIHLPMQSGNTRVLRKMNRRNTREEFIALVDKMRDRIPGLTFSTDVMVGFPTETEEEYEDTLSMMEYMACTEAFMYYYNPREGTKAAAMEGAIDEREKVRRLERLINEQLERQKEEKASRLPFDAEVLITGTSKGDSSRYLGRSEHNEYFSIETTLSHNPGDIIWVRATELSGNTFRGAERV